MNFAKGLIAAYDTKWSYVNTFTTRLEFNDSVAKKINWTTADEENFNLNIVNIDTPQFTNQSIETFVGNRWAIHNGRDELYRFSITVRDQDNLKFYRKFVAAYHLQKTSYFDDIKMLITLWKDADYAGDSDTKLFEYNDVMIENVSQIQFNNATESQIAEFTINFKCAMPISKELK